jgi:hypothetical protein
MGHALDPFSNKGAGAASSEGSVVKRDILEVSASGLNLVFCDLGKEK